MSSVKQQRTFISYSRKDKEFALEFVRELKSAGHEVWLDQLDIPTGVRWDDAIERALRECDIFLIILTPASISSENVKDEIGFAIDHGKRIMPVLFEECDVPLRLRRFQYVDFTKTKFSDGVMRAKQLLENLLGDQDVPVYTETPPKAQLAPKTVDNIASEGLAAVIGVVQNGDHVLMVQRRTRYRALSWQFPAGVLKPGEDSHDKVQGTIMDETGVRCKITRYLGARVHDDTKVLCHYFHCTYLDGDAVNRDEKENSQLAWVHAKDVKDYVTSSLYHEVAALLEDISRKSTSIMRVVLGVILNNGKILLVQRIDGSNQRPQWQLPGGTVERNEAEEAAIAREVFEETGVTCSASQKLGERTHPNTKQLISYWLCDYKSGVPYVKEPDKFFSVLWIGNEAAISVLGDDLFEPVKQELMK